MIPFPVGFAGRSLLFGLNMSGAEFSQPAFPTTADWAYLQSKGVVFVRLPIAWENIQKTLLGALDPTFLSALQAAIAGAHAHGIRVYVGVHNFAAYCQAAQWNSPVTYAGNSGNPATGVNFLGDGTLTSAHLEDLWTRLATALLGSAGLAGYGLMNEPSENIRQYATNKLAYPNGFSDNLGAQNWFTENGAALVQLAAGTNPLGSTYGPAWTLSSGTGFGAVAQSVTLPASPCTIDCYLEAPSGTVSIDLAIGSASSTVIATTTPTRFSFTTTPTAGANICKIGHNTGSAGVLVKVSNAQVSVSGSSVTYVPSAWLPFAQAAFAAIRAVDSVTPIYVCGMPPSPFQFPLANWEIGTQTGAGAIPEAHTYWDAAGASSGGGPGLYSGDFTSYGNPTSIGVTWATPFANFLKATGLKGFIGEFGIPNSSADANASWFTVMQLFQQYCVQQGIPATMWFYNTVGPSGALPPNNLNIGHPPDDPRLTAMLAVR